MELDLSYKERFYADGSVYSPDAYTRLLLDVLQGRQSAFVRDDELLEAWRVWDPLLRSLAQGALPLVPYAYGSRGPQESIDLITRCGYVRNERYKWGRI